MQEGDEMLMHINTVKALADQLRSMEVNITDEGVYMVLVMSLPPFFDNLVTSLEFVSTKDVDLQFIVARLLHEVSQTKECESSETTTLVNKSHKSNEKLCFYCKKPGHFVRNCLKKKNDEKKKANQTCEYHEQMFVTALSANDHTTYDWIVDSSATQLMTFKQECFTMYECISPRRVFIGDDTILEAIGKGNIKAIMQMGGELTHTTITQVLHVPKMKNSLILVSKLISEGFKVEFDKDGYKVNDVRGVVVVETQRDKNLYLLNVKVRKDTAHIANSLEDGAMFWHEKLGYLNMASLKELDAMVDGMNLKEVSLHRICEGYVKKIYQKTSFPKDGATRVSQLLEIIHTDVYRPMRTTSHGGVRYFFTFIDDFSRKIHVYFLKAKGEAFEKFKQYKALVENEIGHKIKML